MEIFKILKSLMIYKYLLFKKLILIIIKVRSFGFSKSLLILNGIKKPSGKFLHVWATTQWRFENFEKR